MSKECIYFFGHPVLHEFRVGLSESEYQKIELRDMISKDSFFQKAEKL